MRDIDLRRVSLRSALTGLALLALAPAAGASSLTPTRDGLLRQVRAAQEHGYSYLQSDSQVLQFERAGLLVRLPGNGDYEVKETVRHPLARPAVKHFVEQLAAGYREACGERLVVTSLVRPRNRQPANASPLSVHPTGMAMDLRISSSWSCRSWLERRLIELEGQGVLEAARERRPPHYHLVLFPRQYLDGIGVEAVALAAVSGGGSVSYQVRHGDSLWAIARHHGTTVSLLREANGLSSDRLQPGQVLAIPAR